MTSAPRMTKQGVRDLNDFGKKKVRPAEEAAPADGEVAVAPLAPVDGAPIDAGPVAPAPAPAPSHQ